MRIAEKKTSGIIAIAIYFGWRGIVALLYVFSMIYVPQIIGKIMDLATAFPYFLGHGIGIFSPELNPFSTFPYFHLYQ